MKRVPLLNFFCHLLMKTKDLVERHLTALTLTLCHWATQKCVIAIPCVTDGSCISTFSYMMSCTCICQLVWLTFRFKIIDSLMQDAWVSSYK